MTYFYEMEKIDFTETPTIETTHLILRPIVAADAENILAMRSNAEGMLHVPRPIMQNLDEAHAFIELLQAKLLSGEGVNWAIVQKATNKFAGNICHFNFKTEASRSEVGYMLHPSYFRQGIMYEALRTVLDWGFDTLKINSVEAVIVEENIASRRLAEKAGFVLEGTKRQSCFHNNQYWNQCHYGLLATEYK